MLCFFFMWPLKKITFFCFHQFKKHTSIHHDTLNKHTHSYGKWFFIISSIHPSLCQHCYYLVQSVHMCVFARGMYVRGACIAFKKKKQYFWFCYVSSLPCRTATGSGSIVLKHVFCMAQKIILFGYCHALVLEETNRNQQFLYSHMIVVRNNILCGLQDYPHITHIAHYSTVPKKNVRLSLARSWTVFLCLTHLCTSHPSIFCVFL
jgi:hypothetical protein